MSLMQVVGASFLNLPLQSNMMLPQTAVTSDHRSVPTHAQTQNIQPASCSPTGADSVNHVQNDNRHPVHLTSAVNHRHDSERRKVGFVMLILICINTILNVLCLYHLKKLEQLTIRSDWPQDGHTDDRSFIPTSQGLLTTAHNADVQTAAQRTAFPHRLRLLQLQPPQPNLPRPPSPVCVPVREAWAPNLHLPSVHSNVLSRSRPSPVCRAEDTGRTWVEASAPPSSHHLYNKDRTRGGAEPHFPPAPHRTSLPLLRFHPDAQRTVTLPRIPQPARPVTAHYPRLQLLRRDPDPPSAVSVRSDDLCMVCVCDAMR